MKIYLLSLGLSEIHFLNSWIQKQSKDICEVSALDLKSVIEIT